LVNVTDSGTISTTQYFEILKNAYTDNFGGPNQTAATAA
jgi:hypothetical protein